MPNFLDSKFHTFSVCCVGLFFHLYLSLLYLSALYFSRLATGYYMYIVGYISRTLLLVLLQVRYQVSSELELDCVHRRCYIHTASPSPVFRLLPGQPEFEKSIGITCGRHVSGVNAVLALTRFPCVYVGLLQLHKSSIFNFKSIIIQFSSKIKSFFQIFFDFFTKKFYIYRNKRYINRKEVRQLVTFR